MVHSYTYSSGIATMGGICCGPSCPPRRSQSKVADVNDLHEIHSVESPSGRLLIFANPNSGAGKSVVVFRERLKPELIKNNIAYELIVTTHAHHALSVIGVRDDLHEFNAILILSGDGLVFEVVNGLVLRSDRDRFFPHLPIGIVPSGSGNGLLASVYHTKSYPLKGNEFLKQALKSVSQVDATAHIVNLTHVETDSGQNMLSFLSIGWALMADIDIESERWRRSLGSARFTAGALVRCLKLRKYRAKLSYLPASETCASSASQHQFPVFDRELGQGSSKSASSSDTVDFSEYHVKGAIPKLADPIPDNWVTIEDQFVLFYAVSISHISADGLFMPSARLNDDRLYLTYILASEMSSSVELMSFLLKIEKGTHLDSPYCKTVPVSAFRLEPIDSGSYITVDGEVGSVLDTMADLLKLWPVEQKKNLTSTKWAERKDSLQSLLKIIETTPSIAFQRSYAEIFDDLKKIIRTDSNVNVVSEAVKVVTAVAEQFPIEFKTFVPGLAPVCFEKFKEKKAVLREPLTKCVDVLIDICGINKLGNAFQEAWQKPNNDVKAQLALAIFNNLNTIRQNDPTPMEFIKQVMPALIKFTTDADPKVRDATLHALAAVQRLYGKDVLSSLVGASVRDDNAKMAKIDTYAEKAAEEAEKAAQLRGATCAAADDSEDSGTVADSAECENAPSVSTIDPWELLTPVDVVALLPSNFYEEIVSKKWTERRDVLEVLVKLLDEHKRLDPSPRHYHDLMSSLKKIVEKDVNINVVILAVKALDGLAQGLRDAFEPFASVCGAVLAKLKEKKAIVRDPLFEFLKTLFTWVQLEKCGELIQTALSSPNPNVRKETCLFLKEYFCKHNATTFNYDITAEFRDNLLKAVDDSDGSVRDAAMEAIGALTRCVGLPFAEKKIFHVFGNDAIKLKKITDYHATYMTDFGTNADPRIVKLYKSNAKAAKPRPSPAVSTAPKRTVPSSAGTVRKSTPPSTAPIRRPVPAPVPVRKPAPTPSAPTRRAPPNVNTSARPASSVQRTMPSTPKAPVGCSTPTNRNSYSSTSCPNNSRYTFKAYPNIDP
ncbi:hypothetical protein QR680_000872 [Steinernema hermaphroditum]|uniref:DAGKc domain-containing protein n=1 Tax=Steinernema hermaphroditum TaxID=289476 RepID=A0AA39LEF0_9BILA|nr:hypothetical protein QR680_000872 [Steinernema hermaphroditum]